MSDAISASSGAFPDTHRSTVDAIRSGDPDVRRVAFDALARSYWKPVYKYLRLRWHRDSQDAQDLTQEFFARAYQKEMLEQYDRDRGRFRTFLRICVDHLAQNEHTAAMRIKRGGSVAIRPWDLVEIEQELSGMAGSREEDPDAVFHREWLRSLFDTAIRRARVECERQGKQTAFDVFERYDLLAPNQGESLTYAQLADEFGVPITQVTNYLAFVRRRVRHHVLAVLRETTTNDAEFAVEVREVLGA
ncbi:MAG: sigma-70 family RNA polymerase sigma factor [Gemmatimonadota bacterium]